MDGVGPTFRLRWSYGGPPSWRRRLGRACWISTAAYKKRAEPLRDPAVD